MRSKTTRTRDDCNPFLKKINEYLIVRDMTPSRLSTMAGLGSSTLSNLLRRNNTPTIPTLLRLCGVLGMRLSAFIQEIEDENPEMIADAQPGVIRHDPHFKIKQQIIDEWSALPVNDRNEMMKRMQEVYKELDDDTDKKS